MIYKKTLTALFITGSIIANPIFASNFFQNLTKAHSVKKNGAHLTKSNKIKNNVNTFVDFSGIWEGMCEGDDEIQTMNVENSDSEITIDGLHFTFGNLETNSTSNSYSTDFSHMILDWNVDHSKLIFNGSFTSYSPNHSFENAFAVASGIISLAEDKLTIEVNGDTSSGESDTTICRFSKK